MSQQSRRSCSSYLQTNNKQTKTALASILRVNGRFTVFFWLIWSYNHAPRVVALFFLKILLVLLVAIRAQSEFDPNHTRDTRSFCWGRGSDMNE